MLCQTETISRVFLQNKILSQISGNPEKAESCIMRPCYQGCKQHNPHFAKLCDELGDYHEICATNKKLGGGR